MCFVASSRTFSCRICLEACTVMLGCCGTFHPISQPISSVQITQMSKKAQIACRFIVNTNSDTALPAAHLREIWFSDFIQPHLCDLPSINWSAQDHQSSRNLPIIKILTQLVTPLILQMNGWLNGWINWRTNDLTYCCFCCLLSPPATLFLLLTFCLPSVCTFFYFFCLCSSIRFPFPSHLLANACPTKCHCHFLSYILSSLSLRALLPPGRLLREMRAENERAWEGRGWR